MISANKFGQAANDDVKLELTDEETQIANKIKVSIREVID